MGRKRRSARQRRFTPRPQLVAPRPAEIVAAPREARETIRPRFGRAAEQALATGRPSAVLLKAATVEYGHVVKDLRRIGILAGATVAVLALATIAVNTLAR